MLLDKVNGWSAAPCSDSMECNVDSLCSQHSNDIAEFICLHSCPRSVEEVYTLAVSLQYHIGDIFVILAELSLEPEKTTYLNKAMIQLENKNIIQHNCDEYLNGLVISFYKNGGQVLDERLSDGEAREIQPFFKRILSNLLLSYDALLGMHLNENLTLEQMLAEINNYTLHSYASWGKLYRNEKISRAFNELMILTLVKFSQP